MYECAGECAAMRVKAEEVGEHVHLLMLRVAIAAWKKAKKCVLELLRNLY